MAERALRLVLAGPWLACATGWAYVSVTMLAVQDVGRWLRG